MMKRTVISTLVVAFILISPLTIAQPESARVNVKTLGDLVQVSVESPIEVGAYQIVIFQGNGTVNRQAALTGFMNPSYQLDYEGEYRWFQLMTNGQTGSITLIFGGCITIDRVNLLDKTGNIIISTSGPLPITICEGV